MFFFFFFCIFVFPLYTTPRPLYSLDIISQIQAIFGGEATIQMLHVHAGWAALELPRRTGDVTVQTHLLDLIHFGDTEKESFICKTKVICTVEKGVAQKAVDSVVFGTFAQR